MTRTRKLQAACSMVAVGLSWCAQEAQARRAGITETSCNACHGASEAQVQVSFDPPAPDPGQKMSIVVTVTSSGMDSAGMAISFPEGGQFSIPSGEPLAVSGTWVIHTQPKPATGGEVQFQLDWVAPSQAGSGAYAVSVLATNGDGRQSGDRWATQSGRLAFGCDAVTLYRDTDGDGVGLVDQFLTDCVGLPGFAPIAGDCDDTNEMMFPGAPELCNSVDDDCDGEIDEEVVDQTYYLDEDGDGFGYIEAAVESCTPLEGYVSNSLDCHYKDATISPNGVEVCDFVDNDCDGMIDEGVEEYCGIGECRRKSALCNVLCTPGEPNAEVCNGLDDDCDGEVDEEFCDSGEVCVDSACVPVEQAPPQQSTDAELSTGQVAAADGASDSGGAPGEPSADPSTGAGTQPNTTAAESSGGGDNPPPGPALGATAGGEIAPPGSSAQQPDPGAGAASASAGAPASSGPSQDGPEDEGSAGGGSAGDGSSDGAVAADAEEAPGDQSAVGCSFTRSTSGARRTGAGSWGLHWLGTLGLVALRRRRRGQ